VPPPPPPYRTRPRPVGGERIVYAEDLFARPVSITFNPIALVAGRVSANVELMLAVHHALVLSPNLLFSTPRSDSVNTGVGFAARDSTGFGGEVGYHYFVRWTRTARGPYFGPSILAGTNSATRSWWGLAMDLGAQAVMASGFTIGGGLGLMYMQSLDPSVNRAALLPRFLLQIGWSF
jgi:hypothetical protein